MLKRLFFSKKTAKYAIVAIVIGFIGTFILGKTTGYADSFDYFASAANLLLALFLYRGYRNNNIQAMQAGCCGNVVLIVAYQASYVLGVLFGKGVDFFITLGFHGSIYLAGEIMMLILETIFAVNHYFTFLLSKPNTIRVALSEAMVLIIAAFSLIQVIVTYNIGRGWDNVLYVASFNISIFACLVLVACSELIVAIDARLGE